ncbi:MAG: DUF4304 domain-containing protein [Candidatus Kapabacteria bacterium]|nr:DUF4304 domain-containing protein [Candidatus Kapabacteria bacterium]
MELKTFKKVFSETLISKGFSKRANFYYSFVKDLIIVIGLQKSSFANGYYINIGYVISQLNPSLEQPQDVDGDVRARFSFDKDGKRLDYFDLEEFLENDQDKLRKQFEENIRKYVEPIVSLDKLKSLLQENQVMLYQTKLSAKQFLGFE